MANKLKVEVHTITWHGIEIELVYVPNKWGVIAHLEIRSLKPSKARLPITETGYRSHFHPTGTVEASGGDVKTLVTQWLDEEAQSKSWKEFEEKSRQGDLFH